MTDKLCETQREKLTTHVCKVDDAFQHETLRCSPYQHLMCTEGLQYNMPTKYKTTNKTIDIRMGRFYGMNLNLKC